MTLSENRRAAQRAWGAGRACAGSFSVTRCVFGVSRAEIVAAAAPSSAAAHYLLETALPSAWFVSFVVAFILAPLSPALLVSFEHLWNAILMSADVRWRSEASPWTNGWGPNGYPSQGFGFSCFSGGSNIHEQKSKTNIQKMNP